MKTKPYPVTNDELHVTPTLVVVLLHGVLGEQEAVPNLGEEDIAFLEQTIHRNHTC